MKFADALAEEVRKGRSEKPGITPAKKACIAVLTPTLGTVSMWWHSALTDLIWPMNMGKAFLPVMDMVGGEVAEMRNRLVMMAKAFRDQQGITLDSLMWVDDDVIISRLAMLTLAAHDRPIASGVYFSKGEVGNEPLIFAGPSSGCMKFKPGETFEAWGWSQGLSLIKMEVYDRMESDLELTKDKYGNTAYYKNPDFGVEANGCLTLGGTEDFYFFENASKLGYVPLIDCTKHAFGWHYDTILKKGYPLKQWDQYVRREPIVWKTKEGEVVWD